MSIERRDIVIVGAGPGGSSAARAAALAGAKPLLVEKDETVAETNACGGFATYALQRKLSLPPEVVERVLSRTRLIVDGQPRVYGDRQPHFFSFRRTLLDGHLARRAVEAGAELLTATRATVRDPARRLLALKDLRSGAEREVEAGVIIFADGPATQAASAFGIGHRPGPRTRTGITFELDGTWGDGETSEINVSTRYVKSYFWIFPKRDCVWVGVGGDPAPLRDRLAEFIQQREDLRGRLVRRKWAGLVPGDLPQRMAADGAMVVGDAAGLVNPITGGGIAFALTSGEMAGRVAAEAVREGGTNADGLSRYSRQFHRTPEWMWLLLMAAWRRSLDRKPVDQQGRVYARMLCRYMSFFHRARLLVDVVLGR